MGDSNEQAYVSEHRRSENSLSVTRTEVSDVESRAARGISFRSLDQVSTSTKPSARSDDARAPIIPVPHVNLEQREHGAQTYS